MTQFDWIFGVPGCAQAQYDWGFGAPLVILDNTATGAGPMPRNSNAKYVSLDLI